MAGSRTRDRSPARANIRLDGRKVLQRLTEHEPQASASTALCLSFPTCKTTTVVAPNLRLP